MTFREISDGLDKALQAVSDKKIVLDKATSAVNLAQNDYNDAVSYAQDLRQQLTSLLVGVLPDVSSNAKVMSPK